jgi:hypothetical protein
MAQAITLLALAQQFNHRFSEQYLRNSHLEKVLPVLFDDEGFSKMLTQASYLTRRFNATILDTPYMQSLLSKDEVARLNDEASKSIADMEALAKGLTQHLLHS